MPERAGDPPRVCVVVLGDLGRSPRMQYQATSLGELAEVDLVGYLDSAPPRALADHPRLRVHGLPSPRSLDPRRGLLLWLDALRRFLAQTFQLLRRLLTLSRPDVLLVQTPPSVPTLGVAWLVARLRRARLVIDWHNLGHTLLALKLGPRHFLVRAMAFFERTVGRLADAHLCVSSAMAEELGSAWRLRDVRVLRDRPPGVFEPASGERRRELLTRLESLLRDSSDGDPGPFTLRGDERPAVLSSSTSWTLDEDFSLLVDAARRLDAAVAASDVLPSFLVVVTGRGPLRDEYVQRFAALDLAHVRLEALWLEADDYPVLLPAADMGLCFHRSSSGLDIPMKVSDMLGAGLPVCAFDYGPALGERLRPGRHGELFTTGAELADRLVALFTGFPAPEAGIETLRRHLHEAPPQRWNDGWRLEARPLFLELLP